MKKSLTIGFLARAANVNVETIRYYQRIGLLAEPVKPEHGYRIYPDSALQQLYFIARAKKLGFSLKEIADLLTLDGADCTQTQSIATQKLAAIKQKQSDLKSMSDLLEKLLQSCDENINKKRCPIIDVLSE